MNSAFQPQLDFDAVESGELAVERGEALIVDLDGFEGPLHLLLELARTQKVDLLRLSITHLAEQYLAFVHAARRRRFALAADYLVMAAWLAYLKSRLLLPRTERAKADEPPAEEMAEALAFRLAKLAAMRQAFAALQSLPQTGRDVFVRGDPEARTVHGAVRIEGDLYELVQAYATQRLRTVARRYAPVRRVEAYPLEDARERLREALPALTRWTALTGVAPSPSEVGGTGEGPSRASCLASTLSAGLEMVRDRRLEARQASAFAELYLRARAAAPAAMAAE